MTALDAIVDLLSYFSSEEQELPPTEGYDGRWQACARAINKAFAEYATALGSTSLTHRSTGYLFQAPTAITITATKGSASASLQTSAALSDVCWRSIRFSDQRIIPLRIMFQNPSVSNGSGYSTSVTLDSEWSFESGVYTAELCGDARQLDTEAISVRSVSDASGSNLYYASDIRFLLPTRKKTSSYGMTAWVWPTTPSTYTIVDNDGKSYLLVTPIPPEDTSLKVFALYPWFSLNVAAISEAGVSRDDLENIVLPVQDEIYEAILAPIAAQRLTGCPFFRNDSVLPELSLQYQAAIAQISKLRKSKAQSTRLTFGP